jgi:hemolysin D
VDQLLPKKSQVAPDGVAQQIAVTTVGQVVTIGQQLLVVAPTEGALQVEALVANLDIGFVKLGQSAAIKVDAFPFTRFGVLHGNVMRVASEAVEEQEAKRGLANAPATANTGGAPPASPDSPRASSSRLPSRSTNRG